MKHTKFIRVLSFLLVLLMMLEILPITGQAASIAYYQTSKADVPIWSAASSKSTKVRTVSQKGTVLKVVDKKLNASMNVWYKLSDGNWVYSGNVTEHSHSYDSGICTAKGCGYEHPYEIKSMSGTVVVTNKDGAKIWNRPYSGRSTNVRKAAYGSTLSVTGKTKNLAGNTWYQLSDGNWVFSGNVAQQFTVKYNANGGKGEFSKQTFLSGKSVTITSEKPTRDGYIFKGWATSKSATKEEYKGGASYSTKKSVTLYAVWQKCAHAEYSAGYCKACGKEYKLDITEYSSARTFVVINDEGALVRSRPYSGQSKEMRSEAYKKELKITAKTKNSYGNTWYRLSDGNWVYSEDIAQQFTVKYNANGGEGAPSRQKFLSGKALNLSFKLPVREGYAFKGWTTSKSASEVEYKPGAPYSNKKSITLYAVWEKCTHKKYDEGYCIGCGMEYKLKISTYSGAQTFIVTNKEGTPLRSRPYAPKEDKDKKAAYKSVLTVMGEAENAAGNTWYLLADGNWVYSGNVTRQYKVTYDANGGKGAPSAQTFLSGEEVKLATKAPARDKYTFQGWSTSPDAKTVDYVPGAAYSKKADLKLYAVWSKCTHTFQYGICKDCKYEWAYETVNVADAVYAVTNSNGSSSYARPYAKASEKQTTYKKGNVVLVTHKATNENGAVWYKLKNGKWMKESDLKKQTTFNTIGAVTASYYTTLAKGDYSAKKITGKWYYLFTYDGKKVYIPVSAFTGESDNTKQLSSVSETLTKAVNKHATTTKTFLFHKKTVEEGYEPYASKPSYDVHIWDLYKLKATAGSDTADALYTDCTYNGAVHFVYTTKVQVGVGMVAKWVKPSKASEYEDALYRVKLGKGEVYPQFTVSVTKSPAEYNSELKAYEFTGYFQNYKMEGKGYAKKSLDLKDYVEMFTSSVSVTDAALALVKPDAAILKSLYKLGTAAWSFSTKSSAFTSSSSYSSKKISLTLYDEKTDTVYRVYKANIKSPICLQTSGDYLQTTYTLYKWSDGQTFDIDLKIK